MTSNALMGRKGVPLSKEGLRLRNLRMIPGFSSSSEMIIGDSESVPSGCLWEPNGKAGELLALPPEPKNRCESSKVLWDSSGGLVWVKNLIIWN
jgi:hypothetical protein